MDDRTLQRVWGPYKTRAVLFPEDPDIHDTQVSTLLEKGGERPGSRLRLAVSGALMLGLPEAKSMDEGMKEIRAATARDDYWQVLNIARSASSEDVKKAYRKRVRQFHPDRWYSSNDRALKNRVETAFRDVRFCYEQAIRAVPKRLSTVTTPPPMENTTPIVTETAWERQPNPFAQPVARHLTKPASRPRSKVASYKAFSQTNSPAGDSLFQNIFEKIIDAT